MKAISIRQPWANLIAHGLKDVENRTWKTKFRGTVLIHAPLKVENLKKCFSIAQKEALYSFIDQKLLVGETSAIIGSVEIVDCIQDSSSIWAEKDCYHWILKNAVLFDTPIKNVKGQLSFWDYVPRGESSLKKYLNLGEVLK